jgi:hypothetical protein
MLQHVEVAQVRSCMTEAGERVDPCLSMSQNLDIGANLRRLLEDGLFEYAVRTFCRLSRFPQNSLVN